MKPFFKYYGGKGRLAPWIVEKIPKHTVYVEPFFGGGAVYFEKGPITKREYREVINDKDGNIVNFFKCLQCEESAKKLLRKIKYSLFSKEMHFEAGKSSDIVERAYAVFLKFNQSFAAKRDGGWGRSCTGSHGPKIYQDRIRNLLLNYRRVQETFIENRDALEVIKKWDSPQTFFYCDPPYIGSNQGHYKGYKEEDFFNLLSLLKNTQGSFLLSTYESGLGFERFTKKTRVTASPHDREIKGGRGRVECLYRKFSMEPSENIKRIYQRPEMQRFAIHPWERSEK